MNSELPTPLTPADCDLTGYRFMPLDVVRLKGSELASSYTPEACWAAMLLWCASWQHVPAGAIPDNDKWIADQAGYSQRGKIDRAWKGVREGALHGWVKCSDGLLYHPVVAEKALEGWIGKLLSRLSGGIGNAKRWGTEFNSYTVTAQIIEACGHLKAIAPQSEMLTKKQVVAILGGSPPDSPPDGKNIAPRQLDLSPPDSPPDRNRDGEGDGEGELNKELATDTHDSTSVGANSGTAVCHDVGQICIAMRGYGINASSSHPTMIAFAEQGVLLETLHAACQAAKKKKPKEAISPNFVIGFIRNWKADADALNVAGATAPRNSPSSKDKSRAAAAASIGLGGSHEQRTITIDAATGHVED